MPLDSKEIKRLLRKAAEERAAIPEDQLTDFEDPDRFTDAPIGVDDDGNFFPENVGSTLAPAEGEDDDEATKQTKPGAETTPEKKQEP